MALVLMLSCFSLTAIAGEKRAIRGVHSNFNDNSATINVEISGQISKSDISKATLGDTELTVEKVEANKSSQSELCYILIDNSKRMAPALKEIKSSVIDYAANLDNEDELVILTYANGGSLKEVISIGAGEEKSTSAIKNAVNSIKTQPNEKTSLYSGLSEAYDKAENKNDFDRAYVLLLTSSMDKGQKQRDDLKKYYHRDFPVYAVASNNDSVAQSDIITLCDKSAGLSMYGHFYKKDKPESAKSSFNYIKKQLNNVSVVTLKTDNASNIANENALSLTIKDEAVKFDSFKACASKDSNAPTVSSLEFEDEKFVITFSEPIIKKDSASCSIKKGNTDYGISSSAEVKNGNQIIVQPTKGTTYNGEYSLEFSGITDIKGNEATSCTVNLENATPIIVKVLKIVGICLVPILFLVALFLILFFLKKKKNVTNIKELFVTQVEETNTQQVHIQQPSQPDGLKLMLYIDTGRGQIQRVEYTLKDSMIVGRSDMCDFFIDDREMSRQHFALEKVETGIAITDLQTTNGTYVNGIPIQSRTYVNSGNKIFAGSTTITVEY